MEKGFNTATKLTSTFDGAFRALVKNDAVRVVTNRIISSGTGEFVDEYFAQMLTPAVENIAFDGEKFTFANNKVKVFSKENLYAGLLGGFTGGLLGGGEVMMHLNSAVELDARMFETKQTGKALGVSDKIIRLAQDAAGLSGMRVQFTDGETGFDADAKTVYLNKETQAPATDVGKLIGAGTAAQQSMQDKNSAAENQTPVYDRNTLSKLSDEELKRMHNEMTERYIEDLPTGADGEKYRNELNKSLTGRDSVISSIVRQNGEIGHPAPQNQINPDIKIDSARQLKIQDILSVDKAQLSKMSISELKEFAAEAAKLNADSMGASSEKMNNYIAQSTAGNEAALIKNIEGIKGDLGIELNNMVLQSEGDGGRMNVLDENKKSNILINNRAQGKAFEQQEFPKFREEKIDAVEQITIKTNQGTRIRADAIGLDPVTGKVAIREFKSSATAPLTKNQKIGFPELKEGGGIVVGKGKGKFIHGYNIPEGTDVEIIRPK